MSDNREPRPDLGDQAWCAHRWLGPATPVTVVMTDDLLLGIDIVLFAELEPR